MSASTPTWEAYGLAFPESRAHASLTPTPLEIPRCGNPRQTPRRLGPVPITLGSAPVRRASLGAGTEGSACQDVMTTRDRSGRQQLGGRAEGVSPRIPGRKRVSEALYRRGPKDRRINGARVCTLRERGHGRQLGLQAGVPRPRLCCLLLLLLERKGTVI